MTNLMRVSTIAILCALAPGFAAADLKNDVCRARAKDMSGYSGKTIPSKKAGGVSTKLSGSATFGLSYDNQTNSPGTKSPAFAGSTSVERQEQAKIDRYQRVYDECMRE